MSRMGTPQQNTFGTTPAGSSQANLSQAGAPLSQAVRERIAKRAYEKWVKRGRPNGSDLQDWCEAEAEVLAEQKRSGGTGSTYR